VVGGTRLVGLPRKLTGLLRNRNVILSLAIGLGLLLGQGAQWTAGLVLPALAVVMVLSTISMTGDLFRSPRAWVVPMLSGIVLNYGVLGGLILVLSRVLLRDAALRTGFVLLAAVPPAVAVLPFTSFLKGDMTFSLLGMLGCYLGAFLFTPLIVVTLLGSGVGLQGLVVTMMELIMLPLILSRILIHIQVAPRLAAVKGPLTNWSFFVVVYTVVGLNRDVFLTQPQSLIPVIAIAVIVTYVLGYLIERVGRRLQIDSTTRTSLLLLGTFKNTGFAAGVALALFDTHAAVPSTIKTIVMLSHVIVLDLQQRRRPTHQSK
jgi:BASS family bile acid:Na+ symporter